MKPASVFDPVKLARRSGGALLENSAGLRSQVRAIDLGAIRAVEIDVPPTE